jgi:hypothetical protein
VLAHALALVLLLPPEGRPFVYWGARPAVVAFDAGEPAGDAARILELHAAREPGFLVLRLSFDRPVADALRLPDGTPVSGRLKAVLYLDTDDDRATGSQHGAADLRTGAERRLELGAVAMGADPEEGRAASVIVSATLHALTREGRRRTLWTGDDEDPARLRRYGDAVEVRIPDDSVGNVGPLRLVVVSEDGARDGRLGEH